MRQKLLALMAACESHVYGNMYAYFDHRTSQRDRGESHAGVVHPGSDGKHDEPIVGVEEGLLEPGHRA